MRVPRLLVLLAQAATSLVLLLLVFNVYEAWLGWILTGIVVVLFVVNLKSPVFLTRAKFRIDDSSVDIQFLPPDGKSAHFKKVQRVRTIKGASDTFVDRGIAGTGTIKNFSTNKFVDDHWVSLEYKVLLEGPEIALQTYYDPPLTKNKSTERSLEFDAVDCFTESEESFVFRIDNVTEHAKITFRFQPARKPEIIKVSQIVAGYRKTLSPVRPTADSNEQVFVWSKKKPYFGSDYLFTWEW